MYDILYADPPWDYDGRTQQNGTTGNKSAINHYPTMTLKQLKELNIKAISNPNSLLFMWTSSPHLPQAIELIQAWGFTYKTIAFVWYKQKTNPGYYTMSECELCIVGKRGSIPTPRGTRNERQFLSEMRTRHSAKPQEIRNRITRMFPTQKKIELFARATTEGWDVFGNEVNGIVLETKSPELNRNEQAFL
jgi:N6-adenosine-specific RNA methylase IME4